MADETHSNMSDHRAILTAMAASEQRQEQILNQLQEMRRDMKEIIVQGKEEARQDRESFRRDVSDLHERINNATEIMNDIKIAAKETKTKLEFIVKLLGWVGAPACAGVVYAILKLI